MDMNIVQKSFTFGNSQITFETGRIARQSHGAVLASMDDTQVLVSVVGAKEAKPGQSFFPLSVDYIEKTYAAGKIPGGFLKREGRPSEKETLTSRLIDRPIRPLFPNGYMNEVQVMIQVISANKNVDPDILAMLGTSAALAIAGVPFKGLLVLHALVTKMEATLLTQHILILRLQNLIWLLLEPKMQF